MIRPYRHLARLRRPSPSFSIALLALAACSGPERPPEVSATAASAVGLEATSAAGRPLVALAGDEDHPRWAPDGERIAFTHVRGGRAQIQVAPRSGGAARRLTDWEAEEWRPSWAPDGRRIAFQSDAGEGIWVAEVDGRNPPRRYTPPGLAAGAPDWSPDGERFVYHGDAAGSMDLWIFDVGTGEAHQLTDHPGNEWHPRWSPDGAAVVFYTTWDGEMTDVWRIAADGSALRRLTDHPAEDWRPAWAPDGRSVVFASGRGGKPDLWLVPAQGGEATRLTDDDAAHDYVDWAPDGRAWIARTDASRSHVYRLDVASAVAHRWLADVATEMDRPEASPGGAAIAYRAPYRDTMNLFVRAAGGGSPRQLAATDASQDAVVWSARGDRLFYVENPGGGPVTANLWTRPLAGGSAEQLTDDGGVLDLARCGDQIVYARDPGATYVRDLWIVAADGGQPRPLLVDPAIDYRVSACSADGRTVFVSAAENGTSRLATLALDDPELRPLTAPGSAAGARPSPDGRRLAYLSDAGGAYDLYVSELDGSAARRVTDSEERESWPSWLDDGTLVYSVASGGRDLWLLEPAREVSPDASPLDSRPRTASPATYGRRRRSRRELGGSRP